MNISIVDVNSSTLQDALDSLNRLGCKPTRSGNKWTAYCLIHEADVKGHKPSLILLEWLGEALPFPVHADRPAPVSYDLVRTFNKEVQP